MEKMKDLLATVLYILVVSSRAAEHKSIQEGSTVRTFGDPEIQTLTGYKYDFEGRGEFTYLQTSNVTIQIRTEYTSVNNTAATYITAVAIKLKTPPTQMEVHLNRAEKLLLFYLDGILICNTSKSMRPCVNPPLKPFVVGGNNSGDSVLMIRSEFEFSSGIIFKTTKDVDGMEIVLTTKANHTKVTGLAGDNVEDEIQKLNSTLANDTISLEHIQYIYGNSCRILNENSSIFHYDNVSGHNFTFYNIPFDNPVFLENIKNLSELFDKVNMGHSSDDIQTYNETCHGNFRCFLAIARHKDISAGQAIMDAIKKAIRDKEYSENVPPIFEPDMPTTVTLVLHENVTYTLDLKLYTKDNNTNDVLRFAVESDLTGDQAQYDIVNGTFSWNITEDLRKVTSAGLSFHVFDKFDKNAAASLSVIFCGCQHGRDECDFSNYLKPEGDLGADDFRITKCNCDKYYTGDFCEKKVDICTIYNCVTRCNNSTRNGENPCDPCSKGYEGDGTSCTDINECGYTYGHKLCEQNCTNTVGSFNCSCYDGYLMTDNTCADIDECEHNKTICSGQQHTECSNTIGWYECKCKDGFHKQNGKCKSATDVGKYIYYSVLTITTNRSPLEILGKAETEELEANLTKMLIANLVKGGSPFTSVEITSIRFIGKDNSSRRVATEAVGGRYQATYNLYSNKTMNSTEVEKSIHDQLSPTIQVPIFGEDVTIRSNDFRVVPDNENPICTTGTVHIRCDNHTSVCKSDNGGSYACQCKAGYQKREEGDHYCIDIDECSFSNKSDICIKGTCDNKVPNWRCRCPDPVYNAVKQIGDGVFRCEGDFQYIGHVLLYLMKRPADNQTIIERTRAAIQFLFNTTMNNTATNIKDGVYPPMADIFMKVDDFNITEKNLIPSPIMWKFAMNYIVHLGEALPNQYVVDYVSEHTLTFDGSDVIGPNASIYSDSAYSICDIPGKTHCVQESTTCIPENGTYSCECKIGYKHMPGEPHHCADIDECDPSGNYKCGGRCDNIIGNWTCNCGHGFQTTQHSLYNITCENIDECNHTEYRCDGGRCKDTHGGWECNCNAGYEHDVVRDTYISCVDIDECQDNKHTCSNNGTCEDSSGNWTCTCPVGRRPNYINETFIDCKDINECLESTTYHCDGPQNSTTCHNTVGGWQCNCVGGFYQSSVVGDLRQCLDVDECHSIDHSCNGGHCINTIGEWFCECDDGYTNESSITNDGRNVTCTDIDECKRSMACIDSLDCINTDGSWECKCENGLHEKQINKTSKMCKVEYQFVAFISLNLYISKSLSRTELEDQLHDRILALYRKVLNDSTIWVEIVRMYGLPSNMARHKRSPTTRLRAVYKIHSEVNRTEEVIKNASAIVNNNFYNKTLVPDSSDIHVLLVTIYHTGKDNVDNRDICSVCDNLSTNCSIENDIPHCMCKEGYMLPTGVQQNYHCDQITCNLNHTCINGTCHTSNGLKTCECGKGFGVVEVGNGTMQCVKDVCKATKCTAGKVCELTLDKTGFNCSCKKGDTCKEDVDSSKSKRLQTIAIATGSSLGGLVLILTGVVVAVCRWRRVKAKEAEQIAMKHLNGNGLRVNSFEGSVLGSNYLNRSRQSLNETRSMNYVSRRGSVTSLPRPQTNMEPFSLTQNGHVSRPVSVEYSDPRKYKNAPSSPKPDYDGQGRPSRNMQNQGMVRVFPESGEILQKPRHDGKLPRSTENGRVSPKPDYDVEPLPDYEPGGLNASRDSGLANGYHSGDSLDHEHHRDISRDGHRYGSLNGQRPRTKSRNTYF